MAIFDLQEIRYLNQNKIFAGKLCLVTTDSDEKAVVQYDLGEFDKGEKIKFPGAERTDVFFAFTENIILSNLKDPFESLNINDDNIRLFPIGPNDQCSILSLNGSNSGYLLLYDIVQR